MECNHSIELIQMSLSMKDKRRPTKGTPVVNYSNQECTQTVATGGNRVCSRLNCHKNPVDLHSLGSGAIHVAG